MIKGTAICRIAREEYSSAPATWAASAPGAPTMVISLNFKLNIFIAIALLALTLANPTFTVLVQKLFSAP